MTTNKIRVFGACVGLLAVTMSAVQAAPDKTVSVNVINTPDVNVANSPSVIIADVWQWTPLMFILAMAALQSLPA